MFEVIRRWLAYRKNLRRRWQDDARWLLVAEEKNAYYEARRRATRARLHGNRREFYHWAKVAAKVARLSPAAAMDLDEVKRVVVDEERRQRLSWINCQLRAKAEFAGAEKTSR
ncbi:hypothetical protein X768_31900 [Mesorhizobium sp. LSJC265A00]|uniref:hypothetical protein n=1 Tax=Mesorhizobium sp. LSJC265A00 TaxID=1287322 RepID=UPI0003CDF371|nr:hypothetical protein [Mesorhizobium sp. LSJC265A00]ESW98082.1 hypothetical protein X768_31900 [Mesorhizobium sp. LSJC265A00]